MKNLIVFAHPNKHSFNHVILERVTSKLKNLGGSVVVRDLYEMKFDPCYNMADFEAMKTGDLPEDVKIEQEFITQANRVIFICPIWWGLFPAIMKGYIDRVFTAGFAVKFSAEGMEGLLMHKKFAMINTMGSPREEAHRTGLIQAFNHIVDDGVFQTCNSPLRIHRILYGVDSVDNIRRGEMLEEVEKDVEQFVLDAEFTPFFS